MPQRRFSLEKLEKFIGREIILKEVPGWLEDGQFHLVFFSGEYGIGKTRLLNRIRDLARKRKYPGAPVVLIDLYHTRHHYPEGLARAIVDCFPGYRDTYFLAFHKARIDLDNARAAGDNRQAAEKLQVMLDSCKDGVTQLSRERGVLLLLDTVERWVYPQGSNPDEASAWDWFKSWLGSLQQGAVLLAGRPEIERLTTSVGTAQPILKSLDQFDFKETRDYLRAVARNSNSEFSFTTEEEQLLHALSGGRPILLALYLDLYLGDSQTRDLLRQASVAEFERILIERLISDPEIGEALKAAGRAPKGLDADLLAALMDVESDLAKKKLDMLWDLSFVKTFLGDKRLFLHDQMYRLLQKIVYDDPADLVEAQAANKVIEEQYRSRIRKYDEDLKKLYEDLVETFEIRKAAGENIVQAIREIDVPRQTVKIERVYYRLRQDILEGLRLYYRYAHEAAASGNGEILKPLEIESYEFLRAIDAGVNYPQALSLRPFIQGLLLLHPVLQAVSDGSSAAQSLDEMLGRVENIPAITDQQSRILRALLITWYGGSPTLKGQVDNESHIFGRALELLRADDPSFGQLAWFKNMAESFAYRQRAYKRRLRGDLIDSVIKDYQDALQNSRKINFWLEESTARNDLGYAQTIKGEFQNAKQNIAAALALRYQAAIGARIALSYSTFAQYDIANQSYEDARKHASYAIVISESLSFLRGQALGHLALAEATRRYGSTVFGLKSRKLLLEEARKSAQFAIDVFDKLGENERVIDARLEMACILRNMILVEDDADAKNSYFKQADLEFLDVADIASKERLSYMRLDALCNRVWLGVYAGNFAFAESAAKETEQVFPRAYFLKDGQPENEAEAQKNPMVWVILGKLHTGLGMIAFDRWNKLPSESEAEKDRILADVVKNMMLSLEYNALFGSSHHRRIREARDKIWQIVNGLNSDELKIFADLLLAAEKAEKIKSPSKLQQFLRDNAFWLKEDENLP